MLALLAAVSLVAADTNHLVLVATTDVHGRATAWDYETDRPAPLGLTRVATLVDSLRRRYPGQVFVFDAGDLIQGNPFATYFARVAPEDPHPVLDAMNAIGYDAATPGNHEFNFGMDVMRRSLEAA
jgi:2',3'-cyclic-nucleotide 2'-phosphodiesterase/3'-nucleotidase